MPFAGCVRSAPDAEHRGRARAGGGSNARTGNQTHPCGTAVVENRDRPMIGLELRPS